MENVEGLTPNQIAYRKYCKPRMESDPEYRKYLSQKATNYNKKRMECDEEFRKKKYERNKAYYAKEESKEKRKEYYEKNKEKIIQRAKERYARMKECAELVSRMRNIVI